MEKVRDRLRRAATALQNAGLPYAVIGGNAIAEWVGRADQAAVKTLQKGIGLGLELKFGAEGQALATEVEKQTVLEWLQRFFDAIRPAKSLEDRRPDEAVCLILLPRGAVENSRTAHAGG